MITAKYFTDLVRLAYAFLEQEYGFSYIDTQDKPRQIFVNYRKEELIVKVKYSYTNLYIEVSIYNHVSVVPPDKYDWKYSVMLLNLIHRENPSFDYNAIMPKVISVEESVKRTADLLKYYGASILSGEEWISWGDITGYSQYVPPELP